MSQGDVIAISLAVIAVSSVIQVILRLRKVAQKAGGTLHL